jgi:hypothetical protein
MVRTVSMLPAATEIVGCLGLMDDLIAVSHECDYAEQANHRPRITHCEIYGRGLPSAEFDRWVSERRLRNPDRQRLRCPGVGDGGTDENRLAGVALDPENSKRAPGVTVLQNSKR